MRICKMEKHGGRKKPEYKTWESMKARCYNKNDINYKNYGGREISVCNNWIHSFKSFFDDMGPKPFPKAQIDRINNDGNYEPENCRWVTKLENSRHTSATKLTMQQAEKIRELYKGGKITQNALGIIYGVARSTISAIITQKHWRVAA